MMKFTINVECSPEEAREFLGLPDMTQLQEQMFTQFQKNMTNLPAGFEAWQDLQKMMWSQMNDAMGSAASANKKKKD